MLLQLFNYTFVSLFAVNINIIHVMILEFFVCSVCPEMEFLSIQQEEILAN